MPRNVADQRLAVEDHVRGVGGLAHLAIHAAFELQLVRVGHLVGRHEIRADRAEVVGTLAEHPLTRPRLQIARRQVVAGAVAEHVRERVRLAHVPRRPAHDHDQLDLVVELLRWLLRDLDDAPMARE